MGKMKKELFRIEDGKKEKEGNQLLKGIYLQVYKGQILGIISDDIREKQCLVDILSGQVPLDEGSIYIDDCKMDDYESTNALKHFIGVIERRSKLIENLTVAENIFVIRGGAKKYFLNKKVLFKQTDQLMKEFGLKVYANQLVSELTILEKSLIELIKACVIGRKLIVLSDITTFLSSTEVDVFIEFVVELRQRGMEFIIIENFDGLLFKHSDRIIVTHEGKTVRILEDNIQNEEFIYALLLGEGYPRYKHRKRLELIKEKAKEHCVFELKHLFTGVLEDVSLKIHRGEVMNILYQDQESWESLFKVIKGEEKLTYGHMALGEEIYEPKGIWQAIEKGVCFIEENPIEKMLFEDMTVLDNLCLTMGNKVLGMWLQDKYRLSIMQHMEPFFDESFFLTPVIELESVALQKLVYGKWLLYLPKLIICHKPFSITDVYMRRLTEEMIEEYVTRGIAVLIVTSNMTEAHMMGNKIVYLKEGRLSR